MNANKQNIAIIFREWISYYFDAILAAALGVYLVERGIVPASLALAAALFTLIAGLIIAAVVDARAALGQMWSRLLI